MLPVRKVEDKCRLATSFSLVNTNSFGVSINQEYLVAAAPLNSIHHSLNHSQEEIPGWYFWSIKYL